MLIKELSVFFPAYNEAANIEATVTKAVAVLSKVTQKWEIIVVDDGSTDKTNEIVKSLIEKEKRLRLITHTPNRGYGEALKSGLYGARYGWIAFTDADNQFDFGEIEKLLAKKEGADIVAGFRQQRRDPWGRRLIGRGWNWLINLFFNLKVKDVDCGFKLVKKEVLDQIPRLKSTRGGMLEPELLAKAKKNGFKIAQVGVSHYPRQHGAQTGADLKVIASSFFDLARLWWRLR